MEEILKLIPIILYFIVGLISLIMAYKSIFSKKFISFHEMAVGKPLDSFDRPLQAVILAIMRVAGLGFFVVAILLFVFPIYTYFKPVNIVKYIIPLLSLVYCIGLFLVNYFLYKETGALTPWKKSLIVIGLLLVGLIISLVA